MYTNSQVQVIKLDLPGVNMQDVRIDVEPGMLTVSGNSKCGTFYRRISLRYNAPLGQLRSNMSQGVLEIDVPNPAM